MEVYLRVFVNFKQNDRVKLLPMVEFAYKNTKNTSTGYIPFELNCGYYPQMSYEEEFDSHSKSKSEDKLSVELRELIISCHMNFHYTQKLQKRAHNKGVKPWSYTLDEKVWLNSKYIKTKCNCKLKVKFFRSF